MSRRRGRSTPRAGVAIASFLVFAALQASGCAGGPEGTGAEPDLEDEYEAVLFDTTRELSEEVLADLVEVAADGTCRFAGTPSALQGIAVNQVIVAGVSDKTPTGLLRLVTGVENGPEGLVLRTVPTCIQMAFRQLHVKFTRTVTDIASPVAQPSAARKLESVAVGKIVLPIWPPPLTVDYYAFNGDSDPSTKDDQVHVTGTLSGGLEFTFSIDVDWGAVSGIPDKVMECAKSLFTGCSVTDLIPEAIVDFNMSSLMKADIAQEGVSFLSYSKELPIYGPIHFAPIQIGLVTLLPEFEVSSRIEGEASSQFSLAMNMEADAGTGVLFSNKGGPQIKPPVATVSVSAPTVDATLDAYSKVRVGPRVALKLYGFAGPRAGMFGFAELEASQDNLAESKPCFTLRGGVEGELSFVIGVDFPVLGPVTLAEWSISDNLWTEEIESGDCTGGSIVQQNPLQNPTFVPWARAYADTVVITGMPYTAPGGQMAWCDLQRGIDGHFVLAGSGNKGLLKVDREGHPVWAKRFLGPTLGDAFIDELLPDRTAGGTDTNLFVAAYPWALLKVDASGNLLWARQFSLSPNRDWWRTGDIEPDGEGGLYLVAAYGTNPLSPLDVDALLVRHDSAGGILWAKRLGDTGRGEVPRGIIPFKDGIVVVGTVCEINSSGLAGGWRMWAVNLDRNGTIIWRKEYPVVTCGLPFEADVIPLTGHETPDGDVIVGGTIGSSPRRSLLAKIKPDGSLSFLTAYRAVHSLNLEDLELTSLAPLPTSGYLAAGIYLPYPYSLGRDVWIASLDSIGKFQWIKRLKSPDASGELMPTVAYIEDGGALAMAYSETLAGGSGGLWSLKAFAKDGTVAFDAASGVTVETVGISEASGAFCPSPAAGQDWLPAVQVPVLSLEPIAVAVEDLGVGVTQLSP